MIELLIGLTLGFLRFLLGAYCFSSKARDRVNGFILKGRDKPKPKKGGTAS